MRNASTALSISHTISSVSKMVVLILESVEKSNYLLSTETPLGPEETSSILNRSVFYWLNWLLVVGARKLLLDTDLYALPQDLATERLSWKINKKWNRLSRKPRKYSLFLTTCETLAVPLLLAPIIPRIAFTAFRLSQPLLLRDLLEYLSLPLSERSANVGYGIIAGFAFLYLCMAVAGGYYWYLQHRALVMLRGCLVALVYEKATRIDPAGSADSKAALTLMSADIEQIFWGMKGIHETWSNVIQIGIAVWLLSREMGMACIVPLIVAVACACLSGWISGLSGNRQARWMEAAQARISVVTSLLSSIKAIKMTGLSARFMTLIQDLRFAEMIAANRFRVLIVWSVATAWAPIQLSPSGTFIVYVISNLRTHQTLDVTRAFTSISLLVTLAQPLSQLFMNVPRFMAALACFERIEKFLLSENRLDRRVKSSGNSTLPDYTEAVSGDGSAIGPRERRGIGSSQLPTTRPGYAIEVRNGSFGWTADQMSLKGINASIPTGHLSILIGPVASGKSTLCKAILGEVSHSHGTVLLADHVNDFAFCDQISFIFDASIRSNIVGSSLFEANWYETVIRAAALEADIASFPDGDAKIAGTGGTNLSGGQRQKVAIARALYSKKSVAVFDDVFSGLDAKSEEHIFRNVFSSTGILRRSATTIILSTHAVKYLPYADQVIVLDGSGVGVEEGTFAELNSRTGYVQRLHIRQEKPENEEATETAPTQIQALPIADSSELKELLGPSRQAGELITYKYYFRAVGAWPTILLVTGCMLWGFLGTFPLIWLKWWTDASARGRDHSDGMYVGVYTLFNCLALSILCVLVWHSVTTVVTNAGMRLHRAALNTVLKAPLVFFSQTDIGTTTNRFSQDMQYIDNDLPLGIFDLLQSISTFVGQVLVIVVSAPFVGISLPILIGVLYVLQKVYLKTSKQLRLMDLEAKSPLYTHFLETLAGAYTIRAYGWVDENVAHNRALLDASQNPYYLLLMIQRWLQFVVDMIVAVVAIVVAALAIKVQGGSGSAGVALTQVMSMSETLNVILIVWTTVETAIGSVSRIKYFVEKTGTEELPWEVEAVPDDWPGAGRVDFVSATAAYDRKDFASLGIKDLNLTVQPGEKLGVCGRSGSGKSSLILTLLRLLDLSSVEGGQEEAAGRLLIDGRDVSTIPREMVRKHITTIPQDPYFLHGTLRLNLDPWQRCSDTQLETALRKVGLLKVFTPSNILLTSTLDENLKPESLSQGQRQLFGLARAILKPAKIVILDEVTSSVDHETDVAMQRIIRDEFGSSTVIAVVHRLNTILDFDRVAVMQTGRLMEIGNPMELLRNPAGSLFKTLYDTMES